MDSVLWSSTLEVLQDLGFVDIMENVEQETKNVSEVKFIYIYFLVSRKFGNIILPKFLGYLRAQQNFEVI